MNEKISKNESSLENITIRNRPMKIAEDYENFFTQEWLQAKEYLDQRKTKQFQEADALNFLLELIFVSVYCLVIQF